DSCDGSFAQSVVDLKNLPDPVRQASQTAFRATPDPAFRIGKNRTIRRGWEAILPVPGGQGIPVDSQDPRLRGDPKGFLSPEGEVVQGQGRGLDGKGNRFETTLFREGIELGRGHPPNSARGGNL